MTPFLSHLTIWYNRHTVCCLNRRQPMSYHQNRSSRHQRVHSILQIGFRTRVNVLNLLSFEFFDSKLLFLFTWTRYSLSASSALVASSRSKTLGFVRSALAIAILCFCPPERRTPRSPTTVLYLSGNVSMNSCAFAIFCNKISRLIFYYWTHNKEVWEVLYRCIFYIWKTSFTVKSISDVLFHWTVEKNRFLADNADL